MTAIIRKGNTVCGFLNALFCNRVSLFMVKEKPKSFVKKKNMSANTADKVTVHQTHWSIFNVFVSLHRLHPSH